MMLVDIKHMKYFIEVVKQGGMTNASKSYILHNLQLVKQLKKDIENEMGTPLFDEVKNINLYRCRSNFL